MVPGQGLMEGTPMRISEALATLAPTLALTPNEGRNLARELIQSGHVNTSRPGHAITAPTIDDLTNFVVGAACCRLTKHAPKYIDVVAAMRRASQTYVDDPENRPLPDFLMVGSPIEAVKRAIAEAGQPDPFVWWNGADESFLTFEFELDARLVRVSGERWRKARGGDLRKHASFSAEYGFFASDISRLFEGVPVIRKEDDDLPIAADLHHFKRFGFRTINTMAEILAAVPNEAGE
jgi:hypothetical protein